MLSLKIVPSFRCFATSASNQVSSKLSITPKVNKDLDNENIPSKPKKPITPWIAYLRERKDDLKRGRQNMKACEITSILSKEWKLLDKTRYEQEYQVRHQEYLEQVEKYEKSLTEEDRLNLALKKDLERENKALSTLRKLHPPKLPRNPANLYCMERCKDPKIKEKLKGQTTGETFKEIFKEYNEMPEEEKEKYLKMQQNDKLRFQDEFRQWYEKLKNDPSLGRRVQEQLELLNAKFNAL